MHHPGFWKVTIAFLELGWIEMNWFTGPGIIGFDIKKNAIEFMRISFEILLRCMTLPWDVSKGSGNGLVPSCISLEVGLHY